MATILITNDDGINSEGLRVLTESLGAIGNIYVIAPDRERSGVSHALTLHRPLKVIELGKNIYAVNGTPTDCVAIGVKKILPEMPDLIVSGINAGPNLGDDITYSGTVSAAIEGTILGIPSFAISLDTYLTRRLNHSEGLYCEYKKCFWHTCGEIARIIAMYIIEHSLPYDTFLNVNVPNLPLEEIKGIKITRQGKRIYENAIKEVYSPSGEKHYWIGGGEPYWEHGEDTDICAVNNGYISITPLHPDLTNHEAIGYLNKKMEFLTKWLNQKK